MAVEPPEITRLRSEMFRAVFIPYSSGFSLEDRLNLVSVVTVGLSSDQVARKSTVESRLKSMGWGTWVCPTAVVHRASSSTRGVPTRPEDSSNMHLKEYDHPGACTEIDSRTGRTCSRRLHLQGTHLQEFASAFGFLELMQGAYIRGKYGAVAQYIDELPTHGYFDRLRARRALLLYALIERNGDFTVPAMFAAASGDPNPNQSFIRALRANIKAKIQRLGGNWLPRTAPYHAMMTELRNKELRFADIVPVGPTGLPRKDASRPVGPLSDKTLSSYLSRTITYLQDLGFAVRFRDSSQTPQPGQSGRDLIQALREHGFASDDQRTEIAPSFEAIHDAFAIKYAQYHKYVDPPVNSAVLEGIVCRTLFPDRPRVSWHEQEYEIACVLPRVIQSVGERLSGNARIDVVRLAVLIHFFGSGIPLIVADEYAADGYDPDRNCVTTVALRNPKRYSVGHARSGQRLWSVGLVRN